jgi:hypothetical protein
MRHLHRTILLLVAATATTGAGPAQAQPVPSDGPAVDPTPAVAGATVEAWDAEVSDIDKLRTPDSPAFVILGAAPTEIQHPTTPTSLAVALGGIMSGNDLAVPSNVAIEFAPYWLFPHPGVTIDAYRDEALLRPLRTLSLSIGTTQTKRTDDTVPGQMIEHTDVDIGLGFRTMLLQWGQDDACTRAARDFAATVGRGQLFTASERQELASSGPLDSDAWRAKRAEIEQRKASAIAAAEASLKKLQNDTCLALAASTTGFSLGLAGAIDVHAADAKLTQAATSLTGHALWATLSYDTRSLGTLAVARFTGRKDAMTSSKLVDAGVRAIYKRKTYGVSAEVLVRHSIDQAADATTYKIDLGFEHKVNDDTWLSVTFGKGFAVSPGDGGSWFSLANLQWNLGKPTL